MSGLFRRAACLVVQYVDELARLILQESHAFGIIEVGYLWDKAEDTFAVIFGNVAFEELLLNEVMEVLIGKVDGKLVKGIGPGCEVLGARKVEKADKGDKIFATETFVECSLSHENKRK